MPSRQTPEETIVPAGFRFSGPVTGQESFYSRGHGGEYLLSSENAVMPYRLSPELRVQQADHLLRGVQEFLVHNPDFSLSLTEAELLDFIRLTDGFAHVWFWRKDKQAVPVK